MARLLGPDPNSRFVYRIVGSGYRNSVGASGVVYSDSAGTVLADVAAYDPGNSSTPGSAINGSVVTVGTDGLLPLFWFPADGTDTLYVTVAGGELTAINAGLDARIDALAASAAVDFAVVHLAGVETVTGVKTFTSSPAVPTPSGSAQATPKSYVDTGNAATLASAQGYADAAAATEATARATAVTAEATARASADTANSAALTAHTAATTTVHGIADTAALETAAGATAKVSTHAAAADPHVRDRCCRRHGPGVRRLTVTADFKQGANLAGKILISGQVAAANTNTTIYTVPALSAVKIASAALCNVGAFDTVISVSVVPSGGTVDGTHTIINAYTLLIGDSTPLPELVGAMLDAGAFISVYANHSASINYLLTGAVSS
jgi:7-cyano-7-deazaguanine synthase in queuosine biosynthesis